MQSTFQTKDLETASLKVKKANSELNRYYLGENDRRQPVHTFYGGAQLFKFNTVSKIAQASVENFKTYAPDPATLNEVLDIRTYHSSTLLKQIHERVTAKLTKEAVE